MAAANQLKAFKRKHIQATEQVDSLENERLKFIWKCSCQNVAEEIKNGGLSMMPLAILHEIARDNERAMHATPL